MALKKYKPTTPGQRFKVISAFDEITTDKPEKSLLRPKKSTYIIAATAPTLRTMATTTPSPK